MPMKEIKGLDGTVYVQDPDGQGFHPVYRAVTIIDGETDLEGYATGIKDESMEFCFEFTLPTYTVQKFLQKVAGMPNNWLKMNGMPKRRKVKKCWKKSM